MKSLDAIDSTAGFRRWPGRASGMRFVFISMIVGFVLQGSAVFAVPLIESGKQVEARLATLAATPFQWDAHQFVQLSGIPSYVTSFASESPVLETAQTLAAHTDIFQRVLTLENTVVLSGLEPQWHWLAEISAAPTGSHGYVSALYVDPVDGVAADTHTDGLVSWLPSHAHKQFSLRSVERSQTVTQQVYSIALDPDQLFGYVGQRLRSQGWAREPALTAEGSSAWRRQGARLMLFSRAGAAGTSLFVHYVE